MMRAVLLVILIIMMGQTAGAQAVITKEQSIFTIDIKENGNALWKEEKFYPLTTKSAISEWNLSLKNESNLSKKKGADINERINRSLFSAENYSGRPMEITDLNITYDMVEAEPNAYGVIRLSFEWVNFSRINGSTIIIGEAFSEGVVPSSDNVLVIRIPEGYDVVNASPRFDKQDDNRLIWDGTMYRTFGKGEPYLVISPGVISKESEKSLPMDLLILVVMLGGGLLLFGVIKVYGTYFNKRVTSGENTEQQSSPADEKSEKEIISSVNAFETPGTQLPDALKSLPAIDEEILGDEEMIERYLIKSNGQAYQSDIVTESGLSKSKISIVLAKMKDEGRILKIRKGKENIIRLAKK